MPRTVPDRGRRVKAGGPARPLGWPVLDPACLAFDVVDPRYRRDPRRRVCVRRRPGADPATAVDEGDGRDGARRPARGRSRRRARRRSGARVVITPLLKRPRSGTVMCAPPCVASSVTLVPRPSSVRYVSSRDAIEMRAEVHHEAGVASRSSSNPLTATGQLVAIASVLGFEAASAVAAAMTEEDVA